MSLLNVYESLVLNYIFNYASQLLNFIIVSEYLLQFIKAN